MSVGSYVTSRWFGSGMTQASKRSKGRSYRTSPTLWVDRLAGAHGTAAAASRPHLGRCAAVDRCPKADIHFNRQATPLRQKQSFRSLQRDDV